MQSIISQPTGSDPETGSGRFQTGRRNLNLSDISKTCNFKNLKYNNEKFPGLFVKFETGTVILFL